MPRRSSDVFQLVRTRRAWASPPCAPNVVCPLYLAGTEQGNGASTWLNLLYYKALNLLPSVTSPRAAARGDTGRGGRTRLQYELVAVNPDGALLRDILQHVAAGKPKPLTGKPGLPTT